MSLIIATKTGEGIVIGADSLLTISGKIGNTSGVLNTYEHSNKIHNLLDLPVAIAFWGIGHIGTRSVRSHILEFENLFKKVLIEEKGDYLISSISKKLYSFVNEEYEKNYKGNKKPILGILVAGVKPEEFLGEIYYFQLPNHKEPNILREKENFGMNWFGITDAITRFYKGFDPRIYEILKKNFEFTSDKINELKDFIQKEIEYKVMFDSMPIQEAINLTYELIELTITRNKFTIGAPAVGGNIDIAVITPEIPFKWVSKSNLFIQERGVNKNV